MTPASGSLQCNPYDPKRETWDLFMQRFEFYLVGTRQTGIAEREKQGIFLNICGNDVQRLANAVAAPQTLWEIDWSELKSKLQAHYAPKPSSLSRRIRFYNRIQAEEETVADFLAGLRVLATDCEFDTQLDWMIRDRLIIGLRDEKLRRRLVARPTLTLTTAIEEALAAEATYTPSRGKRHDHVYQAAMWEDSEEVDPEEDQDGDVHQVRPTRGPKMATKPRQAPCAGCNGNHPRSNCPYLHSFCSYCSKKGHIFRACRALPPTQPPPAAPTRGPRGTAYRRGPSNNDRWSPNPPRRPSDGCLTIYEGVQQTSQAGRNSEIFSTMVSVKGKNCKMQIDSGSPVSIMSWRDIKDLIPTIQKQDLTPAQTALRDCQG